MSKSDKLNNQGAVASRSRSAQKVLDSERRFIDDPIQAKLAPFAAVALLLGGFQVYSVGVVIAAQKERSAHSKKPTQFQYVCPMHDDLTSKKPGLCPQVQNEAG